jgi:hypothetical protein
VAFIFFFSFCLKVQASHPYIEMGKTRHCSNLTFSCFDMLLSLHIEVNHVKLPPGSPRSRLEDNIKIDFRAILCEDGGRKELVMTVSRDDLFDINGVEPSHPDRLWTPPSPPGGGGVKRPGCEVDHSPPSSAEL